MVILTPNIVYPHLQPLNVAGDDNDDDVVVMSYDDVVSFITNRKYCNRNKDTNGNGDKQSK